MLTKANHVVLMVVVALTLSLWIALEPLAAQGGLTPDQTVTLPQEGLPTDRYIVLLRDDVRDPRAVANNMAATHGLGLVHVYGAALKGFAAVVPPGRLTALARDPRVQRVEAEEVQHIVQQTIPTGIDRIEAEANAKASINGTDGDRVKLDVAIIDTGILASHPDLNVAGGANFSGGSADGWSDGNGHGTHVAGTVGAIDNVLGVVGVAPGTPVWAVKVCKNGGTCMTGDMVAGINWVAQKKRDYKSGQSGGINFAAANMSISTRDTTTACGPNSDAVHKAICGVVEQGVVFVLAAGNEGRAKAAYPEALTVAAIADFDGKGGGAGAPTCRNDEDDTLANFSNYGVDIAAPGACIRSTWNNGGYATISGTSMAAPHVTGAVALYLHANNRAPATNRESADAIKAAIIAAALPHGTKDNACSYDNERGTSEPLLFVNGPAFQGTNTCQVAGVAVTAVNDIAISAINAPATVTQGSSASVTVTVANAGTENVATVVVDLTATGGSVSSPQTINGLNAGSSKTVTFTWDTTNASTGTHTLTASHNVSDSNAANNSRSTTSQVTSASAGVNVASISPSQMGSGETVGVTINGTGFISGATVSFLNGNGPTPRASNIQFVDHTSITATVTVGSGGPPRDRIWDVRITNPDGSSATLQRGFTVTP